MHEKKNPFAQGLLESEPVGRRLLRGLRLADRIPGGGAAVTAEAGLDEYG
jgi:hypothetical protein